MGINNPYYLEVISSLNDNGVEYLLVGGIAVGMYGYSRYTGDMDLWINPTSENINRLYSALMQLGYEEDTINQIKNNRDIDHPTPIRLIEDKGLLKIDLMTNLFQNLYTFDECKKESLFYTVEGIKITVIHINHLIELKENSKRIDGNLKDLADAEELKKIRDLNSRNNDLDNTQPS